jgi:hypothetical protein
MDLYEWTKHYIAFRDMMKKQIIKKTFLETSIVVKEKKEEKIYLVMEELKKTIPSLKKLKRNVKIYITTLNNISNCNTLIEDWNKFSIYDHLTIIFVEIQENEKWIIHPATHQSIADKESLEEGIMGLYNATKQK